MFRTPSSITSTFLRFGLINHLTALIYLPEAVQRLAMAIDDIKATICWLLIGRIVNTQLCSGNHLAFLTVTFHCNAGSIGEAPCLFSGEAI